MDEKTEKMQIFREVQRVGSELIAANHGRDIPLTCEDGRGKPGYDGPDNLWYQYRR